MPLHPQVQAMLAEAQAAGVQPTSQLTPEQARAAGRERVRVRNAKISPEPVQRIEERTIPGPAGDLLVRIYRPSEKPGLPLTVLFHGGGWVVGDLENEDTTCRGLANRAGCVVMSVDYRLAPETRFPGPVEDCYAAVAWASENATELGVDGSRIAVAGTSAGGNLSAAVALMTRDRGGPRLVHQVLFCPVTDNDFNRPSYLENAEGYMLTRDSMMWFWDHYLGPDGDRANPYAAPMLAESLRGVAPATIICAEYDPLRDEAEAYADRLRAEGVDVQCSRYEGMTHGFNTQIGVLDHARDAVNEAGDRLKAAFAVPSPSGSPGSL